MGNDIVRKVSLTSQRKKNQKYLELAEFLMSRSCFPSFLPLPFNLFFTLYFISLEIREKHSK